MILAIKLEKDKKINGESFNFGPNEKNINTVEDILNLIKKYWNKALSGQIKKKKRIKKRIF